jgi:hypothetical protein
MFIHHRLKIALLLNVLNADEGMARLMLHGAFYECLFALLARVKSLR